MLQLPCQLGPSPVLHSRRRGAQVVTSVAQYVAAPEQKKVKPFQINILATRVDVESTSSKGLPHLIFEGRRRHLKVKQHMHDSGDKGDTCNTSAMLVQDHGAQHMHDCRDGCDEMPGEHTLCNKCGSRFSMHAYRV